MPDLPLIGGHAPGDSAKAHSATCENLFIDTSDEGQPVLRSRPGYDEVWHALDETPSGDNCTGITESAGTYTVTCAATKQHGYSVGTSVTLSNWAVVDFNATFTITAVPTAGSVKNTFEFTATPGFGNDAAGGEVITANGLYEEEVRAIIRGSISDAPYMIAVVGNRIYDFDPITTIASTPLNSGRFNSTSGPVSYAQMDSVSAFDEIIICDGVSAVTENVDPTMFRRTTGAAWVTTLAVNSNTATFMDGYIIRDDIANTGRFIYSDLYDTSAENPFNFATAEGSFDDVVAVLADRRELWLFGEFTTEVWYNAGDKNLPFKRFQGGFVEIGCAAPMTPQKFDNSIAWLAQDQRGGLTVVRAGKGFQPEMISTPAINQLLEDMTVSTGALPASATPGLVRNAYAFTFRWSGHEFYVLTVPGDSEDTSLPSSQPLTVVYDSNTKKWFHWRSDSTTKWMVIAHLFGYERFNYTSDGAASPPKVWGNRHFVGGDDSTGMIYILGDETDDGTAIECVRTLPVVTGPDNSPVNAGPIELIADQDAGDTITVSLDYAKDSKTFIASPLSRTTTATSDRLMWKRIGRARRWIFRFTQSTAAAKPVKWIRAISARLGE